MYLGTTKKEEIQQTFGSPTDRRHHSREKVSEESWAFAQADPVIQPYQYIPLIGVVAFLDDEEPQSFSFLFTEDDVVNDIGWRAVEAFGHAPYDLITSPPGTAIPSYGSRNPHAREFLVP